MRNTIAALCVVNLTLLTIPCSFANPVGGSVVGGDGNATITGQGTTLTTINQSANRVIINWQDFSIGAGEITRFVQPSATACALNRIISGNPTAIYGSLQANGRVFVINPNGIIVGAGGQIDTKGFTASTLHVSDSSFMAGGKLILSGNSTAGIRNDGTISALGGDVFLIANTVQNNGTIAAPQGTVGLAAGSSVQLVQSGDERLSVLAGNLSAPNTPVGVNNAGTIEAASAELKAAGGNIYALAINNQGIVRATGIVNKNGHIYLAAAGGNIQNSGTLSAQNANGSGGTIVLDGGHNATDPSTVTSSGTIDARSTAAGTSGGLVEILGDHVGLSDSALVDVSGEAGGGTVLIGGDLHGANPEVQNAQATFVSPGAQIDADALILGNGGKVVVWSDDATRFYGTISARGGASGGNGGFVEVSGHQSLDFEGTVGAAAPHGTAGQLLLDPSSLYIINGAAGTGDQDGNLPITFATPNTALNTLSVGTLQSLGDVNITLQAQGTITIGNSSSASANVDLSGTLLTKTLTLSAGNGSGGAGNVVFNSGSSIETGGGNVTINAGQTGDTDGSVTLGAVSTGGGVLSITALNNLSFNGAINAGALTVHSGIGGTGNITFGPSVTVSADSQTYWAGSGSGSSASVNFVNNNPKFLGTAGGSSSPVTFIWRQDASIADNNIAAASQFGSSSIPGSYTIESDGGTVSISTASKVGGSALTLFANGVLTIGTSLNGGNSLVSLVATGNGITINGGATIQTTGAAGQTYNGTLTLGGNTTLNGTILSLAGVTGGSHNLILGNTGAATLNGAMSGVNQLTASGSGTLAVNNTISASSINDSEATTLSGGTVTTTAGQNYTGAVTLGADATLNGTTLSLAGVTGGGNSLTLGNSGVATLNDAVSGVNQLTASGSGTLAVDNTVSAGSINDSEGTTLSGGTVTTTAAQNYTGTVTLGADATLNGTTLGLAGVTGGGHNLTLGNSGTATLNGAVSGVNQLTASGSGTLAVDNTVSASSISDSEATTLSGGTVTASAGQNYTGTVTLGADATLNGSTLGLADVIGGGNNLTLGNSGAATLNGAVSGVNQLTASGSGTLAVDNTVSAGSINDSEATTLSGGTVATTAGQTYTRTVTLGADATLNGTTLSLVGVTGGGYSLTLDNTGVATLNNAVSGVNQLTANGSGTLTVNNTISATSVSDSEATTLNGGTVTTTAGQSYTGVTLGGNTTLNGTTLDLVGVTGGGNSLTLDNSGAATLSGAVSGVNQLTASGSGSLTADGSISAGSINDNEATTLSGGIVQTTGAQTYNDPLTLGFTEKLSSSGNGNITFNSTINADAAVNNWILMVTTGGTTTFGGAVGGLNPLAGVTVNSGTISINSAMTLTGSGTVNLQSQANSAIDANVTAGSVTVHSGLSGTGNITFGGGVTVAADTQSYQAGDGHGGNGTGSTANLANNSPSFLNTAGLAAPNSFTYRQDATINTFPTASQFGGTFPAAYTIESDDGAVHLAGMTLPGALQVVSSGVIDESGALNVSGLASFSSTGSGAGGNITLINGGNSFGSLSLSSANGTQVSVAESGNAVLGNVNVNSGGLSVNSGGTISQVAGDTINVGGLASFTSTGSGASGDIALDNPGNNFGSLGLSSANGLAVSVAEASSTALDTVAVNAGTLDVASAGNITQVGSTTITVGGAANFTAPAGDSIYLGNSGNTFNGQVNFSGNGGHLQNVTVQDTTAFVLSALTLSGNLNVTAGGNITQSGALLINGPSSLATFATGPSYNITLNNFGNDFTTVALIAGTGVGGDNVNLYDINKLNLGNVNVAGNLFIQTGGTVTRTGTIFLVGGQVSINGSSSTLLAQSVIALSVVNIPMPKLDTISYAGVSISLDEAAKILPPGSIGTLWMQLPFPPPENYNYKVEDVSKWTSGHLATAGGTTGPQTPR